ncbi:aminotransferase-like domain-containing protein [Amycolatopsis sp. CA-230715]|uniref:aminotransferase-like domain-containing protein n=1 Tax=Amycolatopsis sp. CA-230715 TaxID=2745196 RepID=UPI001C01A451|nr:PLP-dependent aminotransferase family protein [Amycolatopsis sp. CA-230715]QWF84587.1 Histidinol-phosphate aminotransferase [Amycolatopsis sp. CA-230715]
MVDDSSSVRIVTALRRWITTAPSGAKLPSTRSLVAEHGASPVTVQKALRTLALQGVVESRPGVGTFVRAVRAARANDYGWQTAALGSPNKRIPQLPAALQSVPNDVVALHSGYPARELLPERLVRAAFTRTARTDALITRPPTAGLPELQSWFAAELESATPAGITPAPPSDVVLIPGSQGGLITAFRALVGAGRPLLMESPTYWGAILAAAQVGVEVVPVHSGPAGPDPDALSRAFDQSGARAFYAQPTFASPTGALWSPGLTEQVLEIVRHHGAFLIEDDSAHDFGITAEPHPVAARDDSGHVVYVRSLSKSVSPAVRVAGLIARGPARNRILADTQAGSMYVSGVLQAVALDVVTQPAWRTYLRKLRLELRTRRDLLVRSLREHAPDARLETVPQGGLNLWARLPDTTDLDRVVRECAAAGVVIGSGDEWFPAEPTGKFVRLNYAGPHSGSFPDVARVLGRSLAG